MQKQTLTAGTTTAVIHPSRECHNINIRFFRDGKFLFAQTISFGARSRELTPKETAKVKAAGHDPASKRVIMGNPPATMPAEIALALDQISLACQAEEVAAEAAHKAAVAGIEGLDILRDALNARENYNRAFTRMMEDENNDGARPPRKPASDINSLMTRYPRAAAYLKAEEWSWASHYAKSGAGSKAMERIEHGEDYEQALADMESAWTNHCNDHVWD